MSSKNLSQKKSETLSQNDKKNGCRSLTPDPRSLSSVTRFPKAPRHRSKKRTLSKRQFECVCCMIKGMTVKQMAETMRVSTRTIEGYIGLIKDKLDCKTRYEVIAKALGDDFPWDEFFMKAKEAVMF